MKMTFNHKPLLLCLDLEAGSDLLAAYTGELAKSSNQTIHILYVESRSDTAADNYEWPRKQIDNIILKNLPDVTIEAIAIDKGQPDEAILQYLRKHGIGMIILGHHHNLRRHLHKLSVTRAVLSQSEVPVLVFPLNSNVKP